MTQMDADTCGELPRLPGRVTDHCLAQVGFDILLPPRQFSVRFYLRHLRILLSLLVIGVE